MWRRRSVVCGGGAALFAGFLFCRRWHQAMKTRQLFCRRSCTSRTCLSERRYFAPSPLISAANSRAQMAHELSLRTDAPAITALAASLRFCFATNRSSQCRQSVDDSSWQSPSSVCKAACNACVHVYACLHTCTHAHMHRTMYVCVQHSSIVLEGEGQVATMTIMFAKAVSEMLITSLGYGCQHYVD